MKKTPNEIVIERWQNAARVLQSLSPHEKRRHFDMGTWGDKTDCGTVACAAGHCSLDPWFRRRGFTSSFSESGELCFMKLEPENFFDSEGVNEIFCNTNRRPVSDVIREIKAHIRHLKEYPVDVLPENDECVW